ncbi:LuxR family glucitol operon transcriptional activator [Paenibacillus mucilaginosus]|uniref:tetratricopeptide repeat protein n=1 Tax=Paenibacillus mucilaginosus TaxID=61624 RepID=UPI003D220A3B
MAELEDKERFANLLTLGIQELKENPDYKTQRKKREALPSGQFTSESYIDKIANQLGVSPNTVKSWMGQMGSKYIPSRIEDGKLFGILWVILENTEMDADWFVSLLRTTSIPVIDPPIPAWVSSCLSKAKLLREEQFRSLTEVEIQTVVSARFANTAPLVRPAVKHNLPTRWTESFIGRKLELEAIIQWLSSPLPVCLISGWGGMGKTTIALEAAYACVGEGQGTAAELPWPAVAGLVWISADLKRLSYGDFLDTIAYQLGEVELLNKSLNEKWFVVRDALSSYSPDHPILLVIDSIDTADSGISEYVTQLPQGVKVLLTARENHMQMKALAGKDVFSIPLQGLQPDEGLDYLEQEAGNRIRLLHDSRKKEALMRLLSETLEVRQQLIDIAAGNPKALALSLAQLAEDDLPIRQLIREIGQAGYSLSGLFEYLFGRTWERCSEEARSLWMVLGFFGKPASDKSWGAAAGLDGRRFFQAVEQLRAYALVETERIHGQLHYRAHQTVVAYGEQYLLENSASEEEARRRWSLHYLEYLDTHLKREEPDLPYWNFLLGRDLEPVKREWPNMVKLLEWADANNQGELLIELMLRLSHFLSRVNLPLRIDYGLKASRFALAAGKEALCALFLIDTAGWALMEIGFWDEALRRIEEGLQVVKHAAADDPRIQDVIILGAASKAKVYLKTGRPEAAAEALDISSGKPCSPLIKHRVLLVQGDMFLQKKEWNQAIACYEQANEVSSTYGKEKTIEAYFHLGIAYVQSGAFAKAQGAFERLLYDTAGANQIELIYYQYGMGQLLYHQGRHEEALQLIHNALSIIDSWERTIGVREDIEHFYRCMSKHSG